MFRDNLDDTWDLFYRVIVCCICVLMDNDKTNDKTMTCRKADLPFEESTCSIWIYECFTIYAGENGSDMF